MARTPALPTELLHIIFQLVYAGLSPPELANVLLCLSLVCREWAYTAQSLLYSVFIRYGFHYDQERLFKTLVSSPHLVNKVKCIWAGPAVFSADPIWFSPMVVRDLYEQLASSRTLKELVLSFRNDNFDLAQHHILLSSQNLTTLSLFEIRDFPIHLLYQCRSISRLHIVSTTLSGYNKNTGDPDSQSLEAESDSSVIKNRPQLSHLYIENTKGDNSILKWVLNPKCAFDVSNLEVFHLLDVYIRPEDYALGRSLIGLSASTIQDLAFGPPNEFSDPSTTTSPLYGGLDHAIPNLRRLKLLLQPDLSYYKKTHFFWAANFLSNLPTPHHLEELQLSCVFPGDGLYLPSPDNHGWTTLNHVFSPDGTDTFHYSDSDVWGKCGRFPDLHSVKFGVVRTSPELPAKHRTDRFVGVVPRLLRNLSESDMLEVLVSNEPGYVDNADCWYHRPFPPENVVWGTTIDLTGDSD